LICGGLTGGGLTVSPLPPELNPPPDDEFDTVIVHELLTEPLLLKPVIVYVVDPDEVGAPLKTPDVELKLIPAPGEGSTE
jgi:hypothetical protein